jgi:hypothetical protein
MTTRKAFSLSYSLALSGSAVLAATYLTALALTFRVF